MIPVVYEDEAVLVVDKPAWSVVHPTRGARGALVLVHALEQQQGAPVFPVHRLDRQTSGVLLFAKSADVARLIARQLQDTTWHKRYVGLCRGVIGEELRARRPVPEEGHHRPACTAIVPLAHHCDRYTLLRAEPRTGRRHQIRYHLKHLSHPLVGDVNYGQGTINRFFRATFGLGRMFLHAEYLRLPHPTELRMLELRAPLAEDLRRVLDKLTNYDGPVV